MITLDGLIAAAIVAFAFMAGMTAAEREPLPDVPIYVAEADTICRDTLAQINDVLGQEAMLAIPPDFDPGE